MDTELDTNAITLSVKLDNYIVIMHGQRTDDEKKVNSSKLYDAVCH